MDIEKTALLEHAARCRRVAAEIDHHRKAANRLIAIATAYEREAAKLEKRRADADTRKRSYPYRVRRAS
jgi:hypothetical protein